VGRYKHLDSKTTIVEILVTITTGGAWNAGSGTYAWSLPSITNVARAQAGPAYVEDSGTGFFVGATICGASATTVNAACGDASGSRIVSNSSPVTWATGDKIVIQITMEHT